MRCPLPFTLDWKQFLPLRVATHEMRDTLRLSDGTPVTLRYTHADDGELIQELVRGLSLTSRYQRFFIPVRELAPEMIARFTSNAAHDAVTLLATIRHGEREVAIAMAQYVADPYPDRCDFAVVVDDAWQRNGLGRKLVESLACIAHAAGIERIEGDVLADNEPMLRLMLDMGFLLMPNDHGATLQKVSKQLGAPESKCSPLLELAAPSKPGPIVDREMPSSI